MTTTAAAIRLGGGSAPGSPSAGEVALYTKGDGVLYLKDENGDETALGSPPTPPLASYRFRQTWSGTYDAGLGGGQPEVFGDGTSLTPLVPGAIGTVLMDANINAVTGLGVTVIGVNSVDVDTVFTVYVNDAVTTLQVTFPSGAVGVSTVSLAALVGTGDRVALVVSAPLATLGTITFQASLLYTTDIPA